MMSISEIDMEELAAAKKLLENPGLTMKITNLIGMPIEKGMSYLPDNWQGKIQEATKDALMVCLKGALKTMGNKKQEASPWWHKAAAFVSGGVGGAVGIAALPVELPLSTGIMLRSIADNARSHGEDITSLETQINCLVAFAFGGRSDSDDASESAYFAARIALARAVTEAAEYLAEKAIIDASAPAIARLIALIAARFQVQVTQKVAAQMVPVVGAIGGATINLLFMDHFQDMSNGHFAVRKLERKYGAEVVRIAYDRLPK